MTGPLHRLGGFCVRRRWPVLIVWVLVLVGLAFSAGIAGSQVNDNLTLPGAGSQQATDLLNQRFPTQANGVNPVVLVAPDQEKLTDSKYTPAVSDAVKAFKDDPIVESVTSPLSSAGSDQLAKDKQSGYIALNLKTSASDLSEDDANKLVDEGAAARKAGLAVSYGGYVGQELSTPSTESSEIVGLSMAVIVLLFTFGTFVAMGLPIITALFGLGCGLSIITLLGHVAQVPTVAPTLATMIGLGVGIDYALFVVTRHRDTMHDGMDIDESIARATATSGGAVVFAGCTVIIALLSLAIVHIPLVTTLGYTAALVVMVAVLAAITLLPAILALVGRHIESLKIPGLHHNPADHKPHGWRRWGTLIANRPWAALIVSLLALCALAAPVLGLYLGQQDDGSLPTNTQSRQSYDALASGLGVGQNGPFLISVDMSKKPAKADQSQIDDIDKQEDQQKQQAEATIPPGPQLDAQLDQIEQGAEEQRKQAENLGTDPRLQTLRTDLGKAAGVASVSQPLVNDDGSAAILNLIPATSPSDEKTADLVTTLRDTTIPSATKGADMTAYVGGSTAGYVDLASEISDHLVLTIAVVIALSFLLLVLAFRSIVIPLTAGLMNLISIGAAFGVVTFVFEDGHGAPLIGLDGPVPIVSYVPLMMFAVLFGLSMDYEVFLISHIREGWQEFHDNKLAIIDGIATTGRVITSAALIMVSVFFAFILNGDPTIKQFGVGMGVAVAVDATLVRCALVPAVMILLGKANWWFPERLDRVLPDLSIEGKEYFRQLDEAGKAVPVMAKKPAAKKKAAAKKRPPRK